MQQRGGSRLTSGSFPADLSQATLTVKFGQDMRISYSQNCCGIFTEHVVGNSLSHLAYISKDS